MDFPIKNGDFPLLCDSLPEGSFHGAAESVITNVRLPGTQLMDDSALEEDLSVAVAAVMDVWGPVSRFVSLDPSKQRKGVA